ncbi:MAG: DUF362 domain-containing protein [Armatimonadota bacterium]
MGKSKVAVLKTSPETVIEDYIRLMEMAGISDALDTSKTTILKDNISWHLPMPGANSTPWQLESTILALKKHGFGEIVAVENKTVVTRPQKGEKLNKFDKVFEKYDIPVLYNFEDKDMKWITLDTKAKLNVLPKIFPEGIHIPDYFVDKNIIQLPTMKCHIYTTTTGAMKNAFGGLLNVKRHYTHSWIHETLVDLLKIQKEIHSGLFAVMDGTTAGNGPGPRTLIPVRSDYILASADQVAIDAIAAKMMGFNPMDLLYIRLADEERLGNGRPENIEIVGENIDNVNMHFHVGDNFASKFGDMLWFGPLKALQKLFFHTPLVNGFAAASDYYHDKFWWPRHGQPVLDEWRNNNPWGQLWDRY